MPPAESESHQPAASAVMHREVHHADALVWMAQNPAPECASVVTSLPDFSEFGDHDFGKWHAWFRDSARRVIEWTPATGLCMFFQSDIRYEHQWIDKGYLIHRAIEEANAFLVFHKIVCRLPPGSIAHGRAAYSHLICASKHPRPQPKRPGPDVLVDAGYKPAVKSMGVNACRMTCRFIIDETNTRVIVDPFCGYGTVLAVANAMGLDAVGVDISRRCCKAARKLEVPI